MAELTFKGLENLTYLKSASRPEWCEQSLACSCCESSCTGNTLSASVTTLFPSDLIALTSDGYHYNRPLKTVLFSLNQEKTVKCFSVDPSYALPPIFMLLRHY